MPESGRPSAATSSPSKRSCWGRWMDIHPKQIQVRFRRFIRAEHQFPKPEALKAQIFERCGARASLLASPLKAHAFDTMSID